MKQAPLSLLIVEDNAAISSNIATFFEKQGAVLDFAYDGQQGLELALANFYDCIVLDIALPKLDGLAVCQAIREQASRHQPIIMLTARDSLDDKLTGFAQGADDYLTKPFALEELYARCQALAMRHSQGREKVIQLGKGINQLCLDISAKQITRGGQTIQLQPIPFTILHLLMEAHPRALTRSELCTRLWGEEQTLSDSLRSHLYQLRKGLDKPFKGNNQLPEKPLINTIHGVGFSLCL